MEPGLEPRALCLHTGVYSPSWVLSPLHLQPGDLEAECPHSQSPRHVRDCAKDSGSISMNLSRGGCYSAPFVE